MTPEQSALFTELVRWVRLGMLFLIGAETLRGLVALLTAGKLTLQLVRFYRTINKFDSAASVAGLILSIGDRFLAPKLKEVVAAKPHQAGDLAPSRPQKLPGKATGKPGAKQPKKPAPGPAPKATPPVASGDAPKVE